MSIVYPYIYSEDSIYIKKVDSIFDREVMHSHEFFEIQYVLAGEAYLYLGDSKFEAKRGDVFFTNLGISHCFECKKKDMRLCVMNVLFKPEVLKTMNLNYEHFKRISNDMFCAQVFQNDMGGTPYIKVYDINSKLLKIVESMEDESKDKSDGYMNMLFTYLEQILILFMRLYNEESNKENQVRDLYMTKVLEYIEANCSHKFSLKTLSEVALVSPNYLCAVFKKVTGKTVTEYIQEMRIKEVCRMLAETDITFSNIAWQNGYKNDDFLRKLFIREVGMAPSEYRKHVRDTR